MWPCEAENASLLTSTLVTSTNGDTNEKAIVNELDTSTPSYGKYTYFAPFGEFLISNHYNTLCNVVLLSTLCVFVLFLYASISIPRAVKVFYINKLERYFKLVSTI